MHMRYPSRRSDSSFVTPLIRRVNPLFTNTLFQPVTAVPFRQSRHDTLGRRKPTVRPNHRMHCFQRRAVIQRRPTTSTTKRISQASCLLMEEFGVMRRRQAFQKRCHGRRQAIIDFVSRSPQLESSGNFWGEGKGEHIQCRRRWWARCGSSAWHSPTERART